MGKNNNKKCLKSWEQTRIHREKNEAKEENTKNDKIKKSSCSFTSCCCPKKTKTWNPSKTEWESDEEWTKKNFQPAFFSVSIRVFYCLFLIQILCNPREFQCWDFLFLSVGILRSPRFFFPAANLRWSSRFVDWKQNLLNEILWK